MRRLLSLVAAAILAASAVSAADEGPSPFIHSLMQDEQDVVIELAIPDEHHMERSYDLVRVTYTTEGSDEAAIFADRVFAIDECVEPCPDTPLFEVVDECAPPGDHSYSFRQEGKSVDSEAISVADTGDDCLLDPDEEVDADSGASESSCAVAAPGRGGPAPFIALILLGVGLIAVIRSA